MITPIGAQWIELEGDDLLHEMYRVIGCDSIESTGTLFRDRSVRMVCDDDFYSKGDKVQYNPIASFLYGTLFEIRGNALIMYQGMRNGEPDLIPLPERVANEVIKVIQSIQIV